MTLDSAGNRILKQTDNATNRQLLSDVWSDEVRSSVEFIHGPVTLRKLSEFIEDFRIHRRAEDVAISDAFPVLLD